MTETAKQYEILRTLNIIAEKTKSDSLTHGSKQLVYIIIEIICYGIFMSVFCLALYLSDYLEFKLGSINDVQISLIIASPQWKLIMLFFKILFLFMSLFPLGVGIMIRSSRRKSKKLYEVHKLGKEVIRMIVGGKD